MRLHPLKTLAHWPLGLALLALGIPVQHLFGQAGPASVWQLRFQTGKLEAAALEVQNHCASAQVFEVKWWGPPFVVQPAASSRIDLQPGETARARLIVDTREVRGGRFHGRISVECPSCGAQSGCLRKQSRLDVEIRVTDPGVPWEFKDVQRPRRCRVTRLDGPDLADLYVQRLDQAACVASGAGADTVDSDREGYAYLSALSQSFTLRLDRQTVDLEQLDHRPGFSPPERFLLALVEADRGPLGWAQPVEPAFWVAALAPLLQFASRQREPGWVAPSPWLGEALSLALAQIDGRQASPRWLTQEEAGFLRKRVSELTVQLGLRLPARHRPQFISGVERVVLRVEDDTPIVSSLEGPPGAELSSFGRVQRDELYGPFGYYITEHARIGGTGHFRTIPQKIFPVFGGLIGELAHHTFNSLRRAGILQTEETFVVQEDGGGRGELARSLLLYLQTMALLQPDSSYGQLWRRLSFREVEISPKRVREQQQELQRLYESGLMEVGKASVIRADAVRYAGPPFKGLRLSNELLDVLPVEKFYVHLTGRVELVCPIPYLNPDTDAFARLRSDWGDQWETFEQDSRDFYRKYDLDPSGRRYLPARWFERYQSWMRAEEKRLQSEAKEQGRAFEQLPEAYFPAFVEGLVNVDSLPQWRELVRDRYPQLLAGLVYRGEAESEAYLELATSAYLDTVARSVEAGSTLIIDYMSASPIPNNTMLLAYGNQREEYRQLNPYFPFGMKDVTLPPDSGLLRREAELRGWREKHFGPQEDLRSIAGVKTRPEVAAGLLAAHLRWLVIPRLPPQQREAFDHWLVRQARGRSAPEIWRRVAQRLPRRFKIQLTEADRRTLEHTLEYTLSSQRWEPDNPNFYLFWGSRRRVVQP